MNTVGHFRKKRLEKFWRLTQKYYFCRRVSPARHAPFEFPQGLIAARVEGCSGAM